MHSFGPWHHLQWGTVPDAISSIATAGALLLGLVLLAREINERRRRDAVEEAAQARQVSAWLTVEASPVEGSTQPHFGTPQAWKLHVLNASDQMVYDVIAIPSDVQPDGRYTPFAGNIAIGPLPPRAEPVTDLSDKPMPPTTDAASVKRARVAVSFRDAANVSWMRHYDGRLERRDTAS